MSQLSARRTSASGSAASASGRAAASTVSRSVPPASSQRSRPRPLASTSAALAARSSAAASEGSAAEPRVDLLDQAAAVAQPGERVVLGLVGQALHGALGLDRGDGLVGERAQRAQVLVAG